MKAVDFAEIVNPVPEWNRSLWYGGHFYSGREPSSARYDPEVNDRAHTGVDLAAPSGSPIVAPYPGVISTVSYNTGAGYWVGIRHLHKGGSYFFSRHLHILKGGVLVQRGQPVEKGQQIAKVGSTGASAGPHDHFELIWGKDYAHFTEDRHIDVEWVLLAQPGRKGPNEKMITDIQSMLTDLGYDPGPIDGIWGSKTRAAELQFRRDALTNGPQELPETFSANVSVSDIRWYGGS